MKELTQLANARRTCWIFAGFVALGCTAELGSLPPSGDGNLRADAGGPGDSGFFPADSGGAPIDSGQTADSAVQGDAALGLPCDGVASGGTQTTLGYAEPKVSGSALCEQGEQTRTCVNGMWTAFVGAYPFQNCTVDGFRNCDSTPHGSAETHDAYVRPTGNHAGECVLATVSETRICNNGVWGPWSGLPAGTFETCSVALSGGCDPFSGSMAFPCADGACSLLLRRCVEPTGASCDANNQCEGTCVAHVCTAQQPPSGQCDDLEDCGGCTAGAQCVAGACKCRDSSLCTLNTACMNTCRGGFCAPVSDACDANDQADCAAGAVCGASAGFWTCFDDIGDACTGDDQCQGSCQASTGQCALMSQLGGPCDNDDDCDDSASICKDNLCKRDKGAPCALASDCASGECPAKVGGRICK